jgi:NADPH:quinone reductase-like Zn-dependent oxidoreductase
MKAIRIHEYGGPQVLKYEDAPLPEPAQGEVLVRIHAAGVNPVDWKVREGYLKQFIPHKLPLVPGWDLSGTVERPGPGVNEFVAGDAVYGRANMMRDGTYAEYAVVAESDLAKKPSSLDHIHSAAVPLAALTAWHALIDETMMNLSAGQTVLIHGAAGGVGSFAVQIAKWRGAKVIATGSAGSREFLEQLGADTVIDYGKERFEEIARNVDGVLDPLGGETQARSWKTLKRGGALVSLVGPPAAADAQAHGVRGIAVMMSPNRLGEIARLIDQGRIRPIVSQVLPLQQAGEAQQQSQAGHVRGKIVLRVRE